METVPAQAGIRPHVMISSGGTRIVARDLNYTVGYRNDAGTHGTGLGFADLLDALNYVLDEKHPSAREEAIITGLNGNGEFPPIALRFVTDQQS